MLLSSADNFRLSLAVIWRFKYLWNHEIGSNIYFSRSERCTACLLLKCFIFKSKFSDNFGLGYVDFVTMPKLSFLTVASSVNLCRTVVVKHAHQPQFQDHSISTWYASSIAAQLNPPAFTCKMLWASRVSTYFGTQRDRLSWTLGGQAVPLPHAPM